MCIVNARNSSCGKVMISQACVIPSVHRGSASGGQHPGGVCIGGGAWADTPSDWILRDTVNERAVRILLEWILVSVVFLIVSSTWTLVISVVILKLSSDVFCFF